MRNLEHFERLVFRCDSGGIAGEDHESVESTRPIEQLFPVFGARNVGLNDLRDIV